MTHTLRLVASCDEQTADTLFAAAIEPLPAGVCATAIVAHAASLARDTVHVMRRDDEPAILASIALVIPDQALKVAYLEAIGAQLI